MNPKVTILLGSASDLPVARKAAEILEEFSVPHEVGIASAHRTPEDVRTLAEGAAARGVRVILAAAGLSAALPGVVAAHTTLPVIGIPVAGGTLGGLDALLSIAQMPPGVPVACSGIDWAKNAALLAVRILALLDPDLAARYRSWTEEAARSVAASRAKLEGLPSVPPEAYGG